MNRGAILVVDDEAELRSSASEWLSLSGFSVVTAKDGAEALAWLDRQPFEALVSDMRMPGMDGLGLLDVVRLKRPLLPVVLLTGHGDVALAVEAMRAGAHDFLEKPYDADHLVAVLDRAVALGRLTKEVDRLRIAAGGDLESRFVGSSPEVVALRSRLAPLCGIDVDVLINGETGTGKEVVARALHDLGRRRDRPFVALNCAAIPESVFESEVFGHDRGAFTGAAQKREGKIEHADGGTVFLDEIETMPPALQAKLLRVIQERVVEPLGSNRQIPVDVRFIAATKTDLRREGEAGRFRSDLYFRLATVEIAIPPLRRRRDDVGLLFRHFCEDAARRHKFVVPAISASLVGRLEAHGWPGNVRELKACAERFVLGLPLAFGALEEAVPQDTAPLPERVAAFEARLIREALDDNGGSAQAASVALGIPLRTLNEKIVRHGLREMVG